MWFLSDAATCTRYNFGFGWPSSARPKMVVNTGLAVLSLADANFTRHACVTAAECYTTQVHCAFVEARSSSANSCLCQPAFLGDVRCDLLRDAHTGEGLQRTPMAECVVHCNRGFTQNPSIPCPWFENSCLVSVFAKGRPCWVYELRVRNGADTALHT